MLEGKRVRLAAMFRGTSHGYFRFPWAFMDSHDYLCRDRLCVVTIRFSVMIDIDSHDLHERS